MRQTGLSTRGGVGAAGLPLVDPVILAGGLGVLFGLQTLRVFLPLTSFYLYDALGMDPLAPAGVALLCLCAGFLAPLAERLGDLRRVLAAVLTGIALARLLEQALIDPALDVWLSALGAALFALALPLLAAASRRDPTRFALVILLGVAGDTALHSLARTLDLSWRYSAVSMLIIASLVLLLCLLAAILPPLPGLRGRPGEGWRFALLGPWLALELLLLQNVASVATRTGWPMPEAATVVALGNSAGLALALWLMRSRAVGPARRGALAALLVAGVAGAHLGGLAAAVGTVVGQAAASAGLVALLGGERREEATSPVASGLPQCLLVALLFLYYASFEYSLPLRPVALVLAVAAVLGLAVAALPAGGRARRPVQAAWLTAAILLALAAPTLLALGWNEPMPQTPPEDLEEVTVITYNLHQGFRPDGLLDAEALARVIEGSMADVVVLQEVSRGWVVNGSVDLFEWLRHRLRMDGRFGATAGPLWGNAVLSRFPLENTVNHPLPPRHLPLRRGFLEVELALWPGPPLRLLATHLHHPNDGGTLRREQMRALLGHWDGRPRTIVAGDLNALPESPTVALLRRAGFHDASALLGPASRSTHLEGDELQQIDYVWATGDLEFIRTRIPFSAASDHLPVVTAVRPAE